MMATDSDVNGLWNAFSSKYIVDFIVLGTVFMIPLGLLYEIFLSDGLRSALMGLCFAGFIFGGILSILQLLGNGAADNQFFYFVIRSIFMMAVFAGSVGIALLFSRLARITSK